MVRVGATGGASKARMPEMNAQRLCMDAKPTKRSYGKGDSAFCRIALLGFAIRVGTPVNMKEGDNQRDQVRV